LKHGVSGIISRVNDKHEKEYLMVSAKRDNGEHTGKLYPPSGWMEKGETEQETIVRELQEELQLDIKAVKKIADIEGDIPDLMLHFWECEIIGGEMEMDQKELTSIGWYTIEQLENENVYPATRKLIDAYLR
jgi:8-oxo-dGTP diphosphatase